MKQPAIDLAILLPLCSSARAGVRLPNLFSDHMVLQRDKAVNH